MLRKILVSGAVQRKNAHQLSHGQRYERARLLEVDLEQGSCATRIDYVSPPELCPDDHPNILFTALTRRDGKLWLPTSTEILVYSYPGLERLAHISHPHFQEVHHAAPIGNVIAVASTGLDMVLLLDPESHEPVDYVETLFKPTWHRFRPEVDYRKVNSTKPHHSHPNYVFELEGRTFVTRFDQRDAVNIRDPQDRIAFGDETGVHDGFVTDRHVYFTSVDGRVFTASKATRQVESVVTLNDIEQAKVPLGWCRGFCRSGDIAYVGFSMLRETKIKQNVRWALNRATKRWAVEMPTRVAAYDLAARRKIAEYAFARGELDAVFGIALA